MTISVSLQLACGFCSSSLCIALVISIHNVLHDSMTHHIRASQTHKGNTIDTLKNRLQPSKT